MADKGHGKTNIWWPMKPADWAIDTKHLSLEARGAYIELLNTYWRKQQSLPNCDETLRAIVGVSSRPWGRLRKVLEPLFTITPEAWVHPSMEAELARARANSEKRRKAANSRWGKAGKSDANGYAPACKNSMQMECPSPSPSPGTTCTSGTVAPQGPDAEADFPEVSGGAA